MNAEREPAMTYSCCICGVKCYEASDIECCEHCAEALGFLYEVILASVRNRFAANVLFEALIVHSSPDTLNWAVGWYWASNGRAWMAA
jgi:hypothetical protein